MADRHEWIPYPRISETAKVCRKCGVVRQRNGSNDDRICRGVSKVALRARPNTQTEQERP